MEQPLVSECVGVGITALRLGFAEHMVQNVREERPIADPMAAFLMADVLDGVVLRHFDMDTPIRRVADGVVDQIASARVAWEVARNNPNARAYIGILAVRAAVAGGLNLLHYANTGQVTKGGNGQKATNVATALFVVAAATGGRKRTIATGLLASGVALATLPQLTRKIGKHSGQKYRQL